MPATQTSTDKLAKEFNSAFGQSAIVVGIVRALCEEIITARGLGIALDETIHASNVAKVLTEIGMRLFRLQISQRYPFAGSLHVNHLNDLDKKESQILLLECLIAEV